MALGLYDGHTTMNKHFVLSYYAIAYSIGIIALFFSAILFMYKKKRIFKHYLLMMLSISCVIILGAVLNYINWYNNRLLLKHSIIGLIYITICFVIYIIPVFINDLLDLHYKKITNNAFAVYSILIFVTLVFLAIIIKKQKPIHLVSMCALSVSIIYFLISVSVNLQKHRDNRFFTCIKQIGLLTIILFPLIIVYDILLLNLFPRQYFTGPIILPILYGIWNLLYLKFAVHELILSQKPLLELPTAFITRYKITKREADVARLLLKGKTYKEIMEELFISMPTVKTHVSNIYKKTGTGNKMELANRIKEDS